MTSPFAPLIRGNPQQTPQPQENLEQPQEGMQQPQQEDRWTQLSNRYLKPSERDEEFAKGFNIFGKQLMSPQTAHKIRRKPLIAAKGLAKAFGAGGDLLNFAQSIVGIKKPIALAPTSEHLSKLFDYITGEKIEPLTTGEKILERSTNALGTMLITGGNPLLTGARGTALRPVLRTAAAAVVPAGISVHLENANAPKWLQAASTIGAGLLLHRFQGGSIRNLERDLYNQANHIAGNRTVNARDMLNQLNVLDQHLARGGATAAKTAVRGLVRDFRQQTTNGRIPVQNLMEFRRNIHERMRDIENIRGSEVYWTRFRGSIDHGLDQFSHANPAFGAAYRYANGIHRGIHQSNAVLRFLTNNKVMSAASGAFIKVFFPSFGLPTIGASIAAGHAASMVTALARNPHLRRAYWQVLREAAQRDVKGTLHALQIFNKENDKIFSSKDKKNEEKN